METRVFQDTNPLAFFKAAKYPFEIIPQKNSDSGRVEFLVIGEGIDIALQSLYGNAQIGVLDFIKESKSLHQLFSHLRLNRGKRGFHADHTWTSSEISSPILGS